MTTTPAAPTADELWEQHQEHFKTCTECPETGTVVIDDAGNTATGSCPEALRLADVAFLASQHEVEAAMRKWYPASRYNEEERAAARAHLWHGSECFGECGAP